MKALRFSILSAMSEYFQDPSFTPPMAIKTFSFGFFCFKLTTFLYWPALSKKRFNHLTFQQKFSSLLDEVVHI
jgi:hypothetical protein